MFIINFKMGISAIQYRCVVGEFNKKRMPTSTYWSGFVYYFNDLVLTIKSLWTKTETDSCTANYNWLIVLIFVPFCFMIALISSLAILNKMSSEWYSSPNIKSNYIMNNTNNIVIFGKAPYTYS